MSDFEERAYARGFHDAQEKAKVEGRLVIVDSPEIAALRARVKELEAEAANVEDVARTLRDVLAGWKSRAEAAEAKLATAVDALEAILTCWDGPAYKHVMGPNIDRARAVIHAVKSTNRTRGESEMTDDELAQIVQDHTGFPWFNGMAFVENKGIGFAARRFECQRVSLANDMRELQEMLREQKVYWAADRLRDLAARLDDFKDTRLMGRAR